MPDPTLQTRALRYAAGDLPAADAAAFETVLAADPDAQDALAEAVRLSAACLGQRPPAPDRSFRAAIRDRLRPATVWNRWVARRAYRGHPLAWTAAGVVAAAGLAAVGWSLGDADPALPAAAVRVAVPAPERSVPVAPPPRAVAVRPVPVPSVAADDDAALRAAEIWAELSTLEHVERVHEDELRRRTRARDFAAPHPDRPSAMMAVPIDP